MLDGDEKDDKILAVAKNDMSVNYINDASELPPHSNLEVRRFFEDYKKLEKKGGKKTQELVILQFTVTCIRVSGIIGHQAKCILSRDIRPYFMNCKSFSLSHNDKKTVIVEEFQGREEAYKIIKDAIGLYRETYGDLSPKKM